MTRPIDEEERDKDVDLHKETIADLDAPEEQAETAKGGMPRPSESSCDCGHE